MADKLFSTMNMMEDHDDENRDLSKDIALAVASILAESELYKRDSSSDVSIEYGNLDASDDKQLPRSKSSAGERKVKSVGKAAKVKKAEKSRSSKSKSNVKVISSFQPEIWDKPIAEEETKCETPNVDEMLLESSHAIIKWPSPQPPPAVIPRNATMMDISVYLGRVQTYINQLGYQRQGEPKIKVNTQMSVKHLLDTAKSIIKAGEQIKCLHALVLAIHFTNCTQIIERFPINFKSEFGGKEYKHVILGIYLYGYFGALGISRDNGLQDKPPSFARLSDMIKDFHVCYSESGHTLLEVKIGGIITHDPYSLEPIPWKLHVFNVKKLSEIEVASGIERCAKLLRSKMGSYCLRNVRPIIGAPTEGTSPATTKPGAVLPSVSTNINTAASSRPVTRSRKAIKSKYNVDVHVNASASVGSRLQTKK